MNDLQYMEKLLDFCTAAQVEDFNAYAHECAREGKYDIRIGTQYLEHMIYIALNVYEYYSDFPPSHPREVENILQRNTDTIRDLNAKINRLTSELKYVTNTTHVIKEELYLRLAKLDALEYGGVENWLFYEKAMKAHSIEV